MFNPFKKGDVVKVNDPTRSTYGATGVVESVWNDGVVIVCHNDNGLSISYLYTDLVFGNAARSDANNQQVGGDHYKSLSVQPWDYMKATMSAEQFEGYLRGNVLKYISRYDKKNGVEDLRKAKHYLEKLLEVLTK